MAAKCTSCTKRAHYPGDATTDEGKGLCDRHDNKADRGEKMCALSIRSNNTKRPRVNAFFLDLTDVRCPSASPQQQPPQKYLLQLLSIGVVFGKQGIMETEDNAQCDLQVELDGDDVCVEISLSQPKQQAAADKSDSSDG
eukprot:scaffold2130_cov106-Skeletonema_dohrnii-CCMP3373.AAC.6